MKRHALVACVAMLAGCSLDLDRLRIDDDLDGGAQDRDGGTRDARVRDGDARDTGTARDASDDGGTVGVSFEIALTLEGPTDGDGLAASPPGLEPVIVATASGTHELRVWSLNEDSPCEPFATTPLVVTPNSPVAPAVADLNSDGHADILVGVQNAQLVTLFGNATHTYAIDGTLMLATGRLASIAAGAELNGDSIADAVAGEAGSRASLLFQTPTQSFEIGSVLTQPGTTFFDTITGDLNEDGYLDVVRVAHDGAGSTHVAVWFGSSSGHVSGPTTTTYAGSHEHLALGTDALGMPLLVAAGGSDIALLHPDGTSFDVQAALPIGGSITGLAIADVDGDGTDEIVLANHDDQTLVVLKVEGESVLRFTELALPQRPLDVAALDVGRDGVADLAVLAEADEIYVVHRACD